jgi:hypothetical protein
MPGSYCGMSFTAVAHGCALAACNATRAALLLQLSTLRVPEDGETARVQNAILRNSACSAYTLRWQRCLGRGRGRQLLWV